MNHCALGVREHFSINYEKSDRYNIDTVQSLYNPVFDPSEGTKISVNCVTKGQFKIIVRKWDNFSKDLYRPLHKSA